MNKITITLILIVISFAGQAQSVKGEILISEKSNTEIKLGTNKAVDLYATFREQKIPILFRFKGTDIPLNEEKKEVVEFVFTTILKKDGKVIKKQKREPMPFFPGDMLMPVETFDFISLLSDNGKNSRDNVSKMEPGKYEIILEVKPVNIKGQISPASFRFAIK